MAAAFALAAGAPRAARGDAALPGEPRLPAPGAAASLLDRLDGRLPGWTTASLDVQGPRLDVRMCPAAGGPCQSVGLTDVRDACPASHAGPFCAAYGAPGNPAFPRDDFEAILRGEPDGAAWIAAPGPAELVEQAPAPEPPVPGPRPASAAQYQNPLPTLLGHPLATAAAQTALPLLLGLLAGLGLRRLRGGRRLRSWPSAVPILLLPGLATLLLPFHFLGVGYWDWLFVAGAFSVGAFVAGHRWGRLPRGRELALAIVGLSVAGLLLEAAARLLPWSVPEDLLGETILVLNRDTRLVSTPNLAGALFPDGDPGEFDRRTQRDHLCTRRILHVGDSLVEGFGLPQEQTFPRILETLEPGTCQVNAGFGGTGPDFYWRVAHVWTKRLSVDLVVVHLFPGNDLTDMDYPYALCGGGPLLDYSTGVPLPTCQAPIPPDPAKGDRMGDFAPLPLRLAGRVSIAVRRLVALGLWLGQLDLVEDRDVALWHFTEVMRSLRDDLHARGIPLVVDILPVRSRLAPWGVGSAAFGVSDQMKEACLGLGIPVVDARVPFAAAVREKGDAAWFNDDPPGDVHFNPAGHALLARWLHDQPDLQPGSLSPSQGATPDAEADAPTPGLDGGPAR